MARAAAFVRSGRLDAAANAYRQVVTERPRDGIALFGLGRIVAQLGDPAEAASILTRAAAALPKTAEVHHALANALFVAGRLDASRKAARQAITLDRSFASAWCVVASCDERLGRESDALEAIDAALAIDPTEPNARAIKARLLRRSGDLEGARALLEGILASEASLTPYVAQKASHELAVVLEKLGRYDAAFEAHVRAGEAEAKLPGAQRIDRTHWSRRIAAYRTGLTPEFVRRFDPGAFAGERRAPAFLVGFPRSGTTMTEQVLAAHPGVVTTDELPLLRPVYERVEGQAGPGETVVDVLRRLSLAEAIELRRLYWREADAALGAGAVRGAGGAASAGGARAARVFLDKMPLNLIQLGLIDVIFPEAKVIVALRDPRDVCLSCFVQVFQLNGAMIHFLALESTCRFYAEVMDLWLHLRGILAVDCLEVRYEDTVRDLEVQARRLLAHLGLDWREDVLRFHERAAERFITTPSYEAVREPVHEKAIGKWLRYEKHFAPHLPILERFVREFGYS